MSRPRARSGPEFYRTVRCQDCKRWNWECVQGSRVRCQGPPEGFGTEAGAERDLRDLLGDVPIQDSLPGLLSDWG
jgi:hypothetical protein